MTEGPTARLRAIQIEEKFRGKILQDIFTRSKKIYVEPSLLIGKKLCRATSHGKNILLYFDEYAIRIHLMMYGSIRFEQSYSKPFRQVRLTLFFPNKNLVIYNAPIVEIGEADKIEEFLSKNYGIDPLSNWNKEELINLILERKERKIGDLLLDQKVFNGIGNILRNEILFRARVNPERKIAELKFEEIEKIVEETRKLCIKFLELKKKGEGIKKLLMVYNRKTCPNCGRRLAFYRQEPNKRKTFYCPFCQL
ncbi:hypothetical protein B6U81_06575 [Thermoplasmatales archaeon ex4484_30]|nr:MAG: hypothetical protein FE041_03165 [Thermoplasmata archaeon]OYT59131.1 MAG: hypothetical protein B6U81_06575 [Thermoplasmatales archaeon ex4484_30]